MNNGKLTIRFSLFIVHSKIVHYLCAMRYFIEHSYKGTAYHGWQKQLNGISVQEILEKALEQILREKIEITGSSRTDKGVHATKQFAHFDSNFELKNLGNLAHRLNAILPKDIAIQKIFEVSGEAHARFDAVFRKYIYRIVPEKNPFWQDFAYCFRANFDFEKMNEAGKILTQYTDYQAFSKVHTQVNNFECQIEYAFWEQKDGMILFHIKANRFLRGMVRTIVGTMIEVGLNRISLEEFEQIILSKDRRKAGRAVPAAGLTLVEVGYDKLIFLK